MTTFEDNRDSMLKHLQDLQNGGAVAMPQTADPEVKALLQEIVDACRENNDEEAQRDRDIQTVIQLLTEWWPWE